MVNESTEILDRLDSLRRVIRRRLLAYGIYSVAAGGVVAFLVITALDWLLWLPFALRIVAGVAYIAGFVAATVHWIVRPLRADFDAYQIAGELERRFPVLRDRLTSTVSFVRHPVNGSDELTRQVVCNTASIIRDMPLESVLSRRAIRWRMLLLGLGGLALASVWTMNAEWMRTGFYRSIYPFGSIEWPRRVEIAPDTADQTIAIGESADVRMKVLRGLTPDLRPVVRFREPGGETQVLTLRGGSGDGTFTATIPSVTTPLEYWFEAGDDSTRDRPAAIRVVARPEIETAQAIVLPPAYTGDKLARIHDLGGDAVAAVVGGTVQVRIRASKPIMTGAQPGEGGITVGGETIDRQPLRGSAILFDDGRTMPLVAVGIDGRSGEARFEVRGDVGFRVTLRDLDGFENRGAPAYEVRAVPDAAPRVMIVRPAALIELTASATVLLQATVQDDFRIADASLNALDAGGQALLDERLTDHLQPLSERRTRHAAYAARATLSYPWDIAPLNLLPGDVIQYVVAAHDNFALDGAEPHRGASSPRRIKIISRAEFDTRVRSDLALLEQRLRTLILDQAGLLDAVRSLDGRIALDGMSEAARIATRSRGEVQTRLARGVREAAARLRAVSQAILDNRAGKEEADRIAQLSDTLLAVVRESMAQSSEALFRSAEHGPPAMQRASLAEAELAADDALQRMQSVLREIAGWSGFQELVTRTRDLLNRQEALRAETIRVGRQLLGESTADLDEQQQALLRKNSHGQEQLAADVEAFLDRLGRASGTGVETDAAGADSINEAARMAKSHDLIRHVRSAAKSIERNRTAAATIDQRAAARAIRRMIDALESRDMRLLQRLRKRLADAEEQVAGLLDDQTALTAATKEAIDIGLPNGALGELAPEQRRIRRNTSSLAEEFGERDRFVRASEPLREASRAMDRAHQGMRSEEPTVPDEQAAAVASLERTLEILREIGRQAEEELFRRTLAQIEQELIAIRDQQVAVNGRIAALVDAVLERGRVGRTEAREASKLTRAQGAVRRRVDELLPLLEQVIVYRWALERVTDWMERNREALNDRALNDDLIATTERIVRELNSLITALAETRSTPLDAEFAEAEMTGSSGGEGMVSKPIPTMAELLVLKAMQVDVNRRTSALDATFDRHDPTEHQLRTLREIGGDQREVQRLTQMLTDKAQHP